MTSTTPWANTIAAITDVEQAGAKGQWRIGDALASDLAAMGYGKKVKSSTVDDFRKMPKATFKECVEELRARGFDDYTVEHLRKLHNTARAFSHNERHQEISWATHVCAGTPANLNRAIEALRKLGKTVTPINMQWMMQEWLSEAMNGRREKHAAACVAKAAAKAKGKAAAEKQLAATTEAEKEAAQKERQEAKREAAEADKQIIATAGAPRGDINAPMPKIHALEAAAMFLVAGARADKIKKLEKQALDELDQVLDQIGIDTRQRLLENYTRVVDLAHEIVGRLGGPTHKKFQVVPPQPAPVKPQDIGPYSRAESDRLRARVDELGVENRRLQIENVGLKNEVSELETVNRELRARIAELVEKSPASAAPPPITVSQKAEADNAVPADASAEAMKEKLAALDQANDAPAVSPDAAPSDADDLDVRTFASGVLAAVTGKRRSKSGPDAA